jgi:hypothetical protein
MKRSIDFLDFNVIIVYIPCKSNMLFPRFTGSIGFLHTLIDHKSISLLIDFIILINLYFILYHTMTEDTVEVFTEELKVYHF